MGLGPAEVCRGIVLEGWWGGAFEKAASREAFAGTLGLGLRAERGVGFRGLGFRFRV